jgi:uncharacterized protein (TIGR03437 family)
MRNRVVVVTFLITVVAAVAWADISGTIALPANTAFSLISGATVASGGDILWSGTSLSPQGAAKLFNLGNAQSGAATEFAAITQSELAALPYTTTPIPSGQLAVDDIFAVYTNGGDYSKALVTVVTGNTITIEYATYGASGGGSGTPTIATVENNYGLIQPGLPNYGIAQGSLFFVKGLNLANVTTTLQQSDQPGGLVTTLDGVTVSVTVGTTTKPCYLLYLSPVQIDAVLPGSMPLGTGTITVTNNTQMSAAAPFVVVQSAFGIDTYNGTQAAIYNYPGTPPLPALLTATNAANPGQVVTLWGSGVGAAPNDDNHTYPQGEVNLLLPPTSIPMTIYVGGVPAAIAYAGPSQYPGVDQINFTIPADAPQGCFVSLVVVSGSIVSNAATIPIAATGSACPESLLQILLQSYLGNATLKLGLLQVSQKTTGSSQVANSALAQFLDVQAVGAGGYVGGGAVSVGSCVVQVTSGSTTPPFTTTGLNAGTAVTVTGPTSAVTLSPLPGVPGIYTPTAAVPSTFIPAGGGGFIFDNGIGGTDVQRFDTSFSFPTPISWTNMSSFAAVNRSQPLTVTWTGGSTGAQVLITGSSSVEAGGQGLTASFSCVANTADGQFTVPSQVLLALPPGNGTLDVGTTGNPTAFLAPGLDVGVKYGSATSEQPVTYQ